MPLEDLSKEQLIHEHIDLRRRIGELEILEAERTRTQMALKESKEWYENLFENSPISLLVEDFSAVKQHLDDLRGKGVDDFHQFLKSNPKEVFLYASLVKVVDVNQAALDLLGASSKAELLSDLGHIFTPESWTAFREALVALAMGEPTFEIEAVNQKLSGEPIHIVLRWSVAPGYQDSCSKVFVSILDVTKRRHAEQDRERYIEELKQARNKIEKLTGILPICSSCKKIRDDAGYWHQVESYIRDHTDAEFSHSICPDCSDKLYPEAQED